SPPIHAVIHTCQRCKTPSTPTLAQILCTASADTMPPQLPSARVPSSQQTSSFSASTRSTPTSCKAGKPPTGSPPPLSHQPDPSKTAVTSTPHLTPDTESAPPRQRPRDRKSVG